MDNSIFYITTKTKLFTTKCKVHMSPTEKRPTVKPPVPQYATIVCHGNSKPYIKLHAFTDFIVS
jgi:hypothetical protein